MNYEEKVKEYDLLQRKASLLIQGVSFLVGMQRDIELRDRIIDEYKEILESLIPPKKATLELSK